MFGAGFLTGNLTLDAGILAWFLAQVIKTIFYCVIHHTFDWRRLVGSGGMPSSHSAFVCAAAAAIGCQLGVEDPVFALAVVVALVVMYDACNVRRAAGEQAKVLNYLLRHWDNASPALVEEGLKELLGHTPLQVVMGACLGVTVGVGVTML